MRKGGYCESDDLVLGEADVVGLVGLDGVLAQLALEQHGAL